MIDEDVVAIQRFYPLVYLACHSEHIRASSTKWRLSSHDSAILAHLDEEHGTSPRELQRHLGVAASSLSASLKRLGRLGYLTSDPAEGDRRRREVRLSKLGNQAMQATSVLDAEKLRELLVRLSADERRCAVEGLALLARAAKAIGEVSGR